MTTSINTSVHRAVKVGIRQNKCTSSVSGLDFYVIKILVELDDGGSYELSVFPDTTAGQPYVPLTIDPQ